jgi:hypothetical protein
MVRQEKDEYYDEKKKVKGFRVASSIARSPSNDRSHRERLE